MKTRQQWLEEVVTVGVMVAALVALCMTSGCKGVGSCPDEAGIGRTIKVYEINMHPNARSQVFIGNAGTQTPMYQAPESKEEDQGQSAVTDPKMAAYVTTPTMPATGSTNAGTAAGKYVQQVINDGNKRSAETDLATAATLASGLQQSQVGQTAPQTQREGTSTGTQTQTSSPQQNDSTQVNPNAPVATGGGTAQVTNPTSTQAGAGATPGAVTGGQGGAGTQTGATKSTTKPAEASTTNAGTTTAADAATGGAAAGANATTP